MKTFDDYWCELDEEFDFDMKNPKYEEEWKGKVFLRPSKKELNYPYNGAKTSGGDGRDAYMKKAHETAQAGNTVVALVPAHTGSPWFHEYVLKPFYHIRWLRGTIDDRTDSENEFRTYQNYMVVIMRNWKLDQGQMWGM